MKLFIYKLYCRSCRKKAWMKLPFTVGKLPMTKTFINYIISLNRISTLLHVSEFLSLKWKTVKNIDKAHLKKRPKQFSYRKLRYLSIDEIAVRKGHIYMTVVSDLSTGQIIYAVRGRKEEVLSDFLKRLAKKAKHLQGISMDMSQCYMAAVKKHLPKIPIIFDRFHVTKVLTTMVDEVRKKEWAHCQNQGIKVRKGDRFLFLRNQEDLDPSKQEFLQRLLEINQPIAIAHLLKEQFRAFWDLKSREEGIRFFFDWCVQANMSLIPDVMKAVKTLIEHLFGLLNYFDHRIDNGRAEGINNKIKTMKRQSYGFRDEEYFILKLYNLHKASPVLIESAA
jgi:transposase